MKSEKFFSFKNEILFSYCSLNQNFALSLQTNYINLVRNVAGVSASDDDLHAFGGSAGTLPHTKAVTLSRELWQLVVNGEWFMIHGRIRFKVNGSGHETPKWHFKKRSGVL